jgi:hypothetical protein
MSFDVPIAFCIFNRPKLTAAVFKEIRRRRPRRLLIVGDGARADRPDDERLVAESREIAAQVDWDCTVETHYSDVNLGCRRRMASGLDWAFSKAERLIILEDDCVPNESFFTFCKELLDRFSDDERVMMISGNNFQPEPVSTDSYYFSRWAHIWGWASWRRSWRFFDLSISQWPIVRDSGLIGSMVDSRQELEYWKPIFEQVHCGSIDTWDFSWMFNCWLQGGLTVLPQVNLVRNIGFGADATHTSDQNSPLANLSTSKLEFWRHPSHMVRNRPADEYSFHTLFSRNATMEPLGNKSRSGWFPKIRSFRRTA